MVHRRVTVFGSSRVAAGDELYEQARRLGRLLAQAGYAVYSGGYSGVMEAVSRGAREVGGVAVGITVESWAARQRPNPWLSEVVAAPHLFERIRQLVDSEAYVAFPGGAGTLGEVALTWNLFQTASASPRPLVLVGGQWRTLLACFRDALLVDPSDFSFFHVADTVDGVLPLLERMRGSGSY